MAQKKQGTSTPYRLSDTLQKLMREHDLTAKALAEKSGVPRSTIGGWVNGISPSKLHDVRKVARTLGCSFEYLIFGSEETGDVLIPSKSIRSATFENIHRITIEFIE